MIHKNGIGMDCRPENLSLVPSSTQLSQQHLIQDVSIEAGVYWQALLHVIASPILELVICRLLIGFMAVGVIMTLHTFCCFVFILHFEVCFDISLIKELID